MKPEIESISKTVFETSNGVTVSVYGLDGSGSTHTTWYGRADNIENLRLMLKNVACPKIDSAEWERNVLYSFKDGQASNVTYKEGTTLYRIGGKNGGFWSLDYHPKTEYQWRVDYAIKQEFCNDASLFFKITIPDGSTISGIEGVVGSQGMGLYGGAHQVYIDWKSVPLDWIEVSPMVWG